MENTAASSPPSPPERQRRNRGVQLLVTQQERDELEVRAQRLGMTVSAYLRKCALYDAPQMVPMTTGAK